MSNADDWRRIIVSHDYGNTTVDLRKSIATMAKKLCTEKNEDPDSIESLNSLDFMFFAPPRFFIRIYLSAHLLTVNIIDF